MGGNGVLEDERTLYIVRPRKRERVPLLMVLSPTKIYGFEKTFSAEEFSINIVIIKIMKHMAH